jgi:hypothetical protein
METNTDNNILAQAMQHGIEQQLSLIEAYLKPQTTIETKNALFDPLRELSKSYAQISTEFINKNTQPQLSKTAYTIDQFLEMITNLNQQFILITIAGNRSPQMIENIFVGTKNSLLITELTGMKKTLNEQLIRLKRKVEVLLITSPLSNPKCELIRIIDLNDFANNG